MATAPLFDMSKAKPIAQGGAPLFDMSKAQPIGPDPNNPAASIPNPTPKGTLPNAGDTGEGPIAQGLTTFESHLADAPKAIIKGALAKHWPVIDSQNFQELGEDLKSLNPIATEEGSLPMNIGATAANLLPLAVDMKGGGIAESPIAKIGPPAIRATGKVLNSPIAAPVVGAAIGHSMGEGAAGALVGHALRGTLGKLFGKMETFGEPAPSYPGAPLPEAPAPQLVQGRALAEGAQQTDNMSAGPAALGDIPVRGSVREAIPQQQPIARSSMREMLDRFRQEAQKGLGATAQNPKAPIYQRGGLPEMIKNAPAADIPQGHTAVDSSALQSYKYDAGANEFHARYRSGAMDHVFGDVSPEEAQVFEAAPSKGKAMAAIQQNHPLVAKIVNGKRVAVKATSSQ